MKAPTINFRMRPQLSEPLKAFMASKQLENKTDAIHKYIEDLQFRAKKAERDLEQWKTQNLVATTHCSFLNIEVPLDACSKCMKHVTPSSTCKKNLNQFAIRTLRAVVAYERVKLF